MAQGSLKSGGKNIKKSSSSSSSKKSSKTAVSKKNSGKVLKKHKGRSGTLAPRKLGDLKAAQLKSQIQKGINRNIESELKARAHKVEEGKNFKILGNSFSKQLNKKKKN